MKRSPLVLSVARPYVRRRLRRGFDGVFVEGLDAVKEEAAKGPILIAANHVCWWDALTILAIDEAMGTEGHCLMDAANLASLPFFGWVGAVPLDRGSPRQGLRDMLDALSLLDGPGKSLWIFPQGRQRPAHVRPLDLHGGVHWLARKSGLRVVPMALNYLYREAPQPSIVARFGPSLPPPGRDAAGFMTDLERALEEGLERCDRFVLSGAGAFEALVASQPTTRVPAAGRFLAATLRGSAVQTPEGRSEAHG